MKLEILDINRVIEVNKLPQITNTVFIERDMTPTSDGLFSYEIFGKPGNNLRRHQFGFVDLKKFFVHPVAYDIMIKMNRNFSSLILGDKFFSITKEGDLVEDPNGETGIDFLYANFDKINFADDEKDKKSFNRRNKVSILKQLGREKVFVNKWLIIPPFYRDIDLSSKDIISADELSSMYKKLIGITNTINPNGAMDFLTGNLTEYKVQVLLNEIYSYLTSKLSKKTGIIQKNLLGKSVDYAVRAVISGPK